MGPCYTPSPPPLTPPPQQEAPAETSGGWFGDGGREGAWGRLYGKATGDECERMAELLSGVGCQGEGTAGRKAGSWAWEAPGLFREWRVDKGNLGRRGRRGPSLSPVLEGLESSSSLGGSWALSPHPPPPRSCCGGAARSLCLCIARLFLAFRRTCQPALPQSERELGRGAAEGVC